MKKSVLIIFLALVMFMGLWAQNSQNPNEIVKKCIAALGGEEGIKKHANLSADGEFKIVMNMGEFTGKLKLVRKNAKIWMKVDVTFRGSNFMVLQAFNGKIAWKDQFGTVADQPELNYKSDADHTLELLLEKKAVFSIVKITEIEGKKTVGIGVDFNGKKTTFFIDTESYLPVEVVYKDLYFSRNLVKEVLEKRIRYSRYKKVDGVLFPYKSVFYEKGKKFIEMNFDKVAFAPTVSAGIFDRPDQAPDLRYMEEMLN
ncbi:MAG: outer membrane lipoprotein-sorting protein [bacterium]|nr:outer membrane lipoprotein-sorting protein [bacterium]